MKILIVLIRWKGGVGRVISSIKPLLEKAGNQVEVISREDDLKCFSLKSSFKILRREVKKRDYDVLYTQDWSCALPLIDFKNHYVCFHGIETQSSFLQKLVYLIKGKDIIVVGDSLKKKYPKANLIYNGVDLKDFKNLHLKRIKDSVGFVNWHDDAYNYDKIKEAVEKSGMKFIESNLSLSQEELTKLYNQVEIFISLPESFAGFNISWIEAMACGVPKIIGNYNGVGKSLDINHIKDFKSVEDALKNCRETDYKINPEFDWQKSANKLLEVFK